MDEKNYKLKILPLFEVKLQETLDYIAGKLQNPIAADQFLDAVEEAIMERLNAPEAFEPYRSQKDREHVYYVIPIKNYYVFYVVIDDIMEVRTLVYSRSNLPAIV